MLQPAKQMAIRVLRPFYLERGKVTKVGDTLTLDTGVASALVWAQKAEYIKPEALHTKVALPPQPPANQLPDDHPHVATAKAAMKGK